VFETRQVNLRIGRFIGWVVLSLVITGLIVVYSNDLSVISKLSIYKNSEFAVFMGQSLFDGHAVGASDYPILVNLTLLLLGFLAVFLRRLPSSLILYAKYCVVTNLIFGAVIVHGIKFVVGRVRPYIVVKEPSLFTNFASFGDYVPFIDSYSGSLPSGHTAAVLSFLPIVLCFLYARDTRTAVTKTVVMLCLVGLTLAMATGRVMSLDHFASDCLISMFLGWFFHLFTFYIYFSMPVRIENGITVLGKKKVLGLLLVAFLVPIGLYTARYLLS